MNAKTEVNAQVAADPRPPLLTRPLQPVINLIAAFPASVHLKLLAGFLATAVLLVGMGVNAAIILDRMNQRSQEITALQQQRDDARQMLYAVTVQMHYRAMALLTHDDTFNAKIATAKQTFAQILDRVERHQGPGMDAFFQSVRDSSTRFDAASAQVLSHTTAMAANTVPSRSICSGTWPAEASTNCGSTAAKNTIAFGLLTPTAIPSRRIRAMLLGCAA